MMLATVPSWSEEHHKIMRPFFVGIADMGVRSLAQLIAIQLHVEWSSRLCKVMLGRIIMHQENILTAYATVYMQLMVGTYIPIYLLF